MTPSFKAFVNFSRGGSASTLAAFSNVEILFGRNSGAIRSRLAGGFAELGLRVRLDMAVNEMYCKLCFRFRSIYTSDRDVTCPNPNRLLLDPAAESVFSSWTSYKSSPCSFLRAPVRLQQSQLQLANW